MVIPGTIIRPLLAALGACWALSAAAVDIHAYTEDVPPLNYVDKGKISGYSTEVLRLAAQEAGLSLSIEAQPWLRAYAAVQKSPNALLFTVVRTPEREAQFQWVGPIGTAPRLSIPAGDAPRHPLARERRFAALPRRRAGRLRRFQSIGGAGPDA